MSRLMDLDIRRFPAFSVVLEKVVLATLLVLLVGCSKEPPPAPTEGAPWQDPDEQIKLLSDGDPRLRKLAAKNLGRMGAEAAAAIPELEKLLEDKDPKVRKAVGESLEKIRGTTRLE